MRASKILPLSCLAILAAVAACGGISDPSQEQVATVTGSLTGGAAAPANARVALVWRDGTTGGYAVGADVPIVNGRFSMNLTVPTNAYFFPYDYDTTYEVTPTLPREEQAQPDTSTPGAPPKPAEDQPAPAPGGKVPSGKIGTQDTASGGIVEAMTIAVSGFVVYVDTNNNGTLDLAGPNASSADQVLGGNKELFIAYLKGGGALDYEKLRDKSGILPKHGFNLAWQQGRWLSLDLVELKLSSSPALPSPVCYGGGNVSSSSSGSGSSGGTANSPTPPPPDYPVDQDGGAYDDGGTGSYGGYPSPSDPGLSCAPDGRSFTFTPQSLECPPYEPPTTPPGLCGGGYGYGKEEPAIGCATPGMMSSKLGPEETPPPGWPCPVAVDGGPAPDSGVVDAGSGPG